MLSKFHNRRPVAVRLRWDSPTCQLLSVVTSRIITPDLWSSANSTVFGAFMFSCICLCFFERARNMRQYVDYCQRFAELFDCVKPALLQQCQGEQPSPPAQFLNLATLRCLVQVKSST